MTDKRQDQKINWKEVIVFYTVAVLVSAPFRLGLIDLDKSWPLPYGLSIFYHVLRGIGPAAGFAVMYFFFKSPGSRRFSFFGFNTTYSILAASVIPLGLVVIGVKSQESPNPHYQGLITGLMLVLYSLGEEYGWRGYLQQALEPLKPIYRIILIATLWYLWHLNFLLPGGSVQMHLIHFLSLVLGSWGLLKISQSTYSVLFTSAVHLSFNIVSDVKADLNGKLIVLGIAVLIWIVLVRFLIIKARKNGQVSRRISP